MAATAKKPRTKKAPVEAVEPVPTIAAFKGFDKNLACRGYQYAVGETFEHAGSVVACSSGFHACENPFDILGYYPLIDSDGHYSRFAKVTLSGQIARHGPDSKIAGGRITVEAELKLPAFITAAIDWIVAATKVGAGNATGLLTDKGEDDARIGSSGYDARIGSSGYDAQIGSSGNGAQIGSSGYGAQIGSSGYDARIGSSGNGAQIGSSGYGAQIGSSGNDARIGSSGNGAQIGSSGYGAQIGSSGNGARIGSSGNGAQIGSSGYGAQIDASGERSVVASAGVNATAKGALGTWISLAEFVWRNGRYECLGFATGCIGQDGLKADTAYRAVGGKLVTA